LFRAARHFTRRLQGLARQKTWAFGHPSNGLDEPTCWEQTWQLTFHRFDWLRGAALGQIIIIAAIVIGFL
jgi:hypothetical protein